MSSKQDRDALSTGIEWGLKNIIIQLLLEADVMEGSKVAVSGHIYCRYCKNIH